MISHQAKQGEEGGKASDLRRHSKMHKKRYVISHSHKEEEGGKASVSR